MASSSSSQIISRGEARRLVGEIAKDHGYLGEEVLRRMDQETRREVEEALLKKDLMIGSSVITLAQNLYTSNARFVFELLQNADDNHYRGASSRQESAYVSFHVYSDRIVVENNEDGFTRENLTAICNIGKSSKTGAQGYIGEKGIGFKSVFMAAWKAYIQSGNFAFYFQHRKGDSGMGMISPVWQDPEPEQDVNGAFTRISLFLREVEDPATITAERETIKAQFHELKDTVLLFLKNIDCIKIEDHDRDDSLSFSAATYSIDRGEKIVTLEKNITFQGEAQVSIQKYYVITHLAKDLARSENRKYSVDEEASRAYAIAEVILAFPLSNDEIPIPIVEPQEIFAFLPIRDVGFSFLIQSDFVTQANRQDIVTTSRRNLDLLDDIAKAFVKAVKEFCKKRHPTLQFQWMRYLLNPETHFATPFWKKLVLKIKARLQETPVLRPRGGGSLKLIEELQRLPDFALDRDGEPLFNDIVPQAYLSKRYRSAKDLDILMPYGLTYMGMAGLLVRVRRDLSDPESKMKSPDTDDDWHSRTAKLLMIPFHESLNTCIAELKSMDLLPLHDQQWVSINEGSVYYTQSEGIEIPQDLGLNLINPTVALHEDRKALFDRLGVHEADTKYVRDQILAKYEGGFLPDNLDLSSSYSHLKYLYLSLKVSSYSRSKLANIQIYSQDGTLGNPPSEPFYLSNDERYGAQELLKSTEPGNIPGAGAPGFQVNFVHSEYFNDPPANAGHPHEWTEWLHKYVKIRRHLKLTSTSLRAGRTVLSGVCNYLAKNRPEVFLGALKHYWGQEKIRFEEEPSLVESLRRTEVLCRGDRMTDLSSTFLPTLELERRCARYIDDTDLFPFLFLEEPLREETYPAQWEFLHITFGVGLHCDLRFYLTVLEVIKDEDQLTDTFDQSSKVYNLYEAIQAQCLESDIDDREAKKEQVKDFFELDDYILIPTSGTTESSWAPYDDCIWDAPSHMATKFPLHSLYQGYFSYPGIDANTLTQFFRNTLGVSDATWHHFISEIEYLDEIQCTDFDRINDLYIRLNEMSSNMTGNDATELRQAFEEKTLIYVVVDGEHSWLKVSECLWASATAIRGRATLNDHYENLKNFFVTFLGVAELDFGMILDKLVESTGRESVSDIKETLWIFNSLLQRQNPLPSPTRFLESSIFPIKYPTGRVELRTSRTEFAIVDRQSYGDAFADQAKLLDFSLDEVHRLKPFLRWCGLDSRYLSLLVKEVSQLQGGDPTHISTQDRDVSRRAHGLFRIAMHYDSPRASHSDHSLYHLLRNARVYETDGISSQLILSQGGHELSTEVGRSELHLNEIESGLEIYIPRDVRSQDFCYRSKLPPQLLEWMMTQPATQIREKIEPAAILVVNNVINANIATVDWILEAEGIIEVEVADEIVDDHTSISETPTLQNLGSFTPQSSHGHPSPPIGISNLTGDREIFNLQSPSPSLRVTNARQESSSTSNQRTDLVRAQSGLAASRVSAQPRLHVNPLPESPYATPTPDRDDAAIDEDRSYENLLDNIITAARRAVFPNVGSFNMLAMLNALPGTNIPVNDNFVNGSHIIRSASRIERDKKIGAAGELFVFELLLQLVPHLPHFSRDNWESTIRRYVTVHPEYASMDAWNGRETSDIVYDDVEGALTELLVDKGYLAEESWRDQKPRYYIEVKSTTGACDVPFYMSKHQYQRMQDLSDRAAGSSRQELYVIFRVFNLYSDSINVRVYMDPDALRETGGLRFTAESWSVVPTLSFT